MSVDQAPWYKQFWLWFLIVPVLLVMAGTFYLLYISIVTHDGVILDNHYRDGKGYSARTQEDAFARRIGLAAELYWADDQLSVQLKGELQPLPESLELIIAYPTTEAYDIFVILEHRGLGQYTATLPETVSGRRLLQIHPVEAEIDWRLHFTGNVPPLSSRLELLPKPE